MLSAITAESIIEATKYTRGQWVLNRERLTYKIYCFSFVHWMRFIHKLGVKALSVPFMSVGRRWFGNYGLSQRWPISNELLAWARLLADRPALEGSRDWELLIISSSVINDHHPTIKTCMIKEHNEKSVYVLGTSVMGPLEEQGKFTVTFTQTPKITVWPSAAVIGPESFGSFSILPLHKTCYI